MPLFARLDAQKVLEEIRSEAEAAAQAAEKSEEHPENIAFLEQITIDDFARVDLRVAEITACEPVKKSKKLLKLTLNDGSDTPRIVCSGIAPWYGAGRPQGPPRGSRGQPQAGEAVRCGKSKA